MKKLVFGALVAALVGGAASPAAAVVPTWTSHSCAINFCVGLVAIRTTSILGVLRAKYLVLELLSGLLVPVAFFPEPVRKVLVWLPFLHMNDTPGRIWLGLATGADAVRALALQAGWTVALLLLGRVLWNATARRIEVQGG